MVAISSGQLTPAGTTNARRSILPRQCNQAPDATVTRNEAQRLNDVSEHLLGY